MLAGGRLSVVPYLTQRRVLIAGVFSADPVDATLTEQSGAQVLVAKYDCSNGATTPTNARFVIARADGANIGADAHRFGFSARGT